MEGHICVGFSVITDLSNMNILTLRLSISFFVNHLSFVVII